MFLHWSRDLDGGEHLPPSVTYLGEAAARLRVLVWEQAPGYRESLQEPADVGQRKVSVLGALHEERRSKGNRNVSFEKLDCITTNHLHSEGQGVSGSAVLTAAPAPRSRLSLWKRVPRGLRRARQVSA